MKFRYTFQRAEGSRSTNTLATDAEVAVGDTVAALDPSHGKSVLPNTCEPDKNPATGDGSVFGTVVEFEVADTINLDDLRNLLTVACARHGIFCVETAIRPPNAMAGLPGGDAG